MWKPVLYAIHWYALKMVYTSPILDDTRLFIQTIPEVEYVLSAYFPSLL